MEAIGQLTGGVAHDFNNLLTVIAGNLEMIEGSLSDPDQREMLKEAQDALQEGAKLTAQLLAFGRRQPLNPEPTDIGPLVSNFAELMRRTLGESIGLSIVITGSAHLAVVDATQLQNALLNLVINARDAMARGGRLTIEISHARLDADYAQMYPEVRTGRYVLIAVTDTGEGMSEEVRQRAFEPFYTTKPTGAGTGLGLSMVYGFVKQSGGNVQLYSELGRGTSVRVSCRWRKAFSPRRDLRRASWSSRPCGAERRRYWWSRTILACAELSSGVSEASAIGSSRPRTGTRN